MVEATVELPILDVAPEIENSMGLNTGDSPSLLALRGNVVLLEMSMFGYINCQRVTPSLISWQENYTDQGLVVISNRYPEFAYERDLDNLKDSIERLEITYPVMQDNHGKTW